MTGRLAVLGATGYTGKLVCVEARRSGIPLRLLGRREGALAALARPGEELHVVDARDLDGLVAALDGVFALVSLAGPFMDVGFAPVEAAIAAGVHYLDTTGEQDFAQRVYEQYGTRAAERGVVLLTAFGFDYVPGDLAARLAAEGLEPLDEVAVSYSVAGAAPSRGTRRTIGRLAGRPHLAYESGRLVPSSFGATARRVTFPFGEREVVEWQGTEPLTVPRHTDVGTVRSYFRAPRAAARLAPLARLAGPLLGLLPGEGPSEERRRQARFAVVAEARGLQGEREVALTGTDVYGLTAVIVVRGAEALRAGEARGAGALAPAEAFEAAGFVERLAPLLRRKL